MSEARAFLARFEASRSVKLATAANRAAGGPGTVRPQRAQSPNTSRGSHFSSSSRAPSAVGGQTKRQQHPHHQIDRIQELEQKLVEADAESTALRSAQAAMTRQVAAAGRDTERMRRENAELAQVAMGAKPREADEALAEALRRKEDEAIARQTRYEQLLADSVAREREHARASEQHACETEALTRKRAELLEVIAELHATGQRYERRSIAALAEAAARNQRLKEESRELATRLAGGRGLQLHETLRLTVRDANAKAEKLHAAAAALRAENAALRAEARRSGEANAALQQRLRQMEEGFDGALTSAIADATATFQDEAALLSQSQQPQPGIAQQQQQQQQQEEEQEEQEQQLQLAQLAAEEAVLKARTLEAERSALMEYTKGLEGEMRQGALLLRLLLRLRASSAYVGRLRAMAAAVEYWRAAVGSSQQGGQGGSAGAAAEPVLERPAAAPPRPRPRPPLPLPLRTEVARPQQDMGMGVPGMLDDDAAFLGHGDHSQILQEARAKAAATVAQAMEMAERGLQHEPFAHGARGGLNYAGPF